MDKTLSLNKQLNVLKDKKTIQGKKIEDEIKKINNEIVDNKQRKKNYPKSKIDVRLQFLNPL